MTDRTDKERLDWLERAKPDLWAPGEEGKRGWTVISVNDDADMQYPDNLLLRNAIDAAMDGEERGDE